MIEETHYKVLKILAQNSTISQRELASELGVSLGKTNYCLQALLQKGMIKASNFKNNKNKLAYAYLLTPMGIEQKSKLTLEFLQRKRQEYEVLKREIDQLTKEIENQPSEDVTMDKL
ncbi:MAG: EPS-associated MarR family transcriptional regulator [Saprospiraceae bacterium]|jgi:EPS-associated MarR family transcriptional regulator